MGQANEEGREGTDEGAGQMPPPQSPPHLSLPPQAVSADAAATGGGRDVMRGQCSQCESDAVAGDAAAAALVVQLDVMQILTV